MSLLPVHVTRTAGSVQTLPRQSPTAGTPLPGWRPGPPGPALARRRPVLRLLAGLEADRRLGGRSPPAPAPAPVPRPDGGGACGRASAALRKL
jgi:hypothetical protein